MNTKNLAAGTIAGAIAFFILGFLFYGLLLADFFANNMSNPEIMKDPPNIPLIFVGNIFYAFLLTYIYDHWAGIRTFVTGAKAGALIGVLFALSYGCINVATTTMGNMNSVLASVGVELIMGAVGGGVIGWILGKVYQPGNS